MNRKLLSVAALAAGAATGGAAAQSSVTLYGVIDSGISYTSHARTADNRSAHQFAFGDGIAQGNRWGLRGSEDLSSGLKAVFTLESGFNSGTGALGQGGALFGRQAFVGLQQAGVGTLTFGRQYASTVDYLGGKYSTGGNTVLGNFAYHTNDIDQLTSSRINNAVKFASADFSGLTFGGLYGFSNAPGSFGGEPRSGASSGASRAYSFGANYANGAFGIGAAFTHLAWPGSATPAFPTSLANIGTTGVAADGLPAQLRSLRTYGVGAKYTVGPAVLWALATRTHLKPVGDASTNYHAYEAGGKYALTPALSGALGYTYTRASGPKPGHWNQVDAALDYALSKRTDVYLLGIYQQASGDGVQAQIGDSSSIFPPSGPGHDNQTAVRVAIRHRF